MDTSRIALVIDSCTDVPPADVERYGMYVVAVAGETTNARAFSIK